MWNTHDFTKTSTDRGVHVIDVSQQGRVITLEGSGSGVQAGDSLLFKDNSYGVRFWDQDDLGAPVESPEASYQVRSVEYNEDGISWIACTEHYPRVKVKVLQPER